MSEKEFIMRGQTASGETETLNFGMKDGYAYRLTQFDIYPSQGIGTTNNEMCGSVTAGKTAVAPTDPNFNDNGLIATAIGKTSDNPAYPNTYFSIVNDTFLITQNLILMVQDAASAGDPVNWQCRFVAVKMSEIDQADQNYKQFMIFDE